MTLNHDDVRDLAAGFVLGALSPDEEAAVRDHLSTCTELHPEFAELGGVVPYLASSLEPVEPPAALRDRILAAAAAERPSADVMSAERTSAERMSAERTAVTPSPVVAAPIPAPVAPPVAFPTAAERHARDVARAGWRQSVGTWGLRIAAVLAIVALGAWNVQLQTRLGSIEDDLTAATAYQQGVADVLNVATQPGAQVAIISPADPSSSARGLAASGTDGTVVMSMHDLSPTSGNQVYEAWVIVGTDAPVPLGGFVVGKDGTAVFRGSTALAAPGAILALTLEPAPGATAPTMPVLNVGILGSNA